MAERRDVLPLFPQLPGSRLCPIFSSPIEFACRFVDVGVFAGFYLDAELDCAANATSVVSGKGITFRFWRARGGLTKASPLLMGAVVVQDVNSVQKLWLCGHASVAADAY